MNGKNSIFHCSSNQRGLTLVEVVAVFLIVSITATLATVSMKAGIDNRQAKQVSNALQSVANAVKMYELENSALPQNLDSLIQQGYIKENELPYSDKYTYSFAPNNGNPSQWSVQALCESGRLVSAQHRSDGSFVLSDVPHANANG